MNTALRAAIAGLDRPLGFRELLTPDGYNPKLKKGRARGYASAILHFAPADLSGYDVCQYRSAGCTAACLNTAGHGGIIRKGQTTNPVQLARIARTVLFFEHRAIFNDLLVDAIEQHVRRSIKRGLTPVVRLNGTSDLPWHMLKLNDGRTVMDTFPTVTFYDYTKHPQRAALRTLPANYSLTFSRSETNDDDVRRILARGGNVAVVFATGRTRPLPLVWHGYRVIDADRDDLRFLDPRNVVVGLRAKGKARGEASGFVEDPDADTACWPIDPERDCMAHAA